MNSRYVNFGYGDETNEVVYDTSTPRLQQIKAEYDPHHIFNQWFDIQRSRAWAEAFGSRRLLSKIYIVGRDPQSSKLKKRAMDKGRKINAISQSRFSH